jgi:hypothetical protein
MRRLALLLALGAYLMVGAATAHAADPKASHSPDTSGDRVQDNVVISESPRLHVQSLGTVKMAFDFAVPEGWKVTPKRLTLNPQEEGYVTLRGEGDAGKVTVTGTAIGKGKPGGDKSAIQLTTNVLVTRPFDPVRYIPTVGAAILIPLGIVWFLWRVRPWTFRLTRKEA